MLDAKHSRRMMRFIHSRQANIRRTQEKAHGIEVATAVHRSSLQSSVKLYRSNIEAGQQGGRREKSTLSRSVSLGNVREGRSQPGFEKVIAPCCVSHYWRVRCGGSSVSSCTLRV